MNRLLPRSVPKREQLMPCRQANDAEIGLFAGLIGVDSALGARNQLMAVENRPVGWFFCKLLSQNGWLKRDAAHGCNRGLSSIGGSMQGEGGSCQPAFTDQK